MYYQSALNQRVPLGGSAIFHTGRWMTIEMAQILATTITAFESKPEKEKKELINDLAKQKQKVSINKTLPTIESMYIIYIIYLNGYFYRKMIERFYWKIEQRKSKKKIGLKVVLFRNLVI